MSYYTETVRLYMAFEAARDNYDKHFAKVRKSLLALPEFGLDAGEIHCIPDDVLRQNFYFGLFLDEVANVMQRKGLEEDQRWESLDLVKKQALANMLAAGWRGRDGRIYRWNPYLNKMVNV